MRAPQRSFGQTEITFQFGSRFRRDARLHRRRLPNAFKTIGDKMKLVIVYSVLSRVDDVVLTKISEHFRLTALARRRTYTPRFLILLSHKTVTVPKFLKSKWLQRLWQVKKTACRACVSNQKKKHRNHHWLRCFKTPQMRPVGTTPCSTCRIRPGEDAARAASLLPF